MRFRIAVTSCTAIHLPGRAHMSHTHQYIRSDNRAKFRKAEVAKRSDEYASSEGGIEFRIAQIPKRSGQVRQIFVVSKKSRGLLRALLPELQTILASFGGAESNYAFEKGKNCALNAFQHIGRRYTLSMDICDFFDSVSVAHVEGIIPKNIVDQCFIFGSPRQGLPTSPLIATIAFVAYDRRIIELLQKLQVEATYTRYADDLIFSFDERRSAGKIEAIVQQVLAESGFKINKRKTKLQDAANGRVIITGLGVDSHGIHPTRRTRKKARAAAHQQNASSLHGLTEWQKCKLPSVF